MTYFGQNFNTNLKKIIQIIFKDFIEDFFSYYFKNIPQKVVT